jgi:hypothetical protein
MSEKIEILCSSIKCKSKIIIDSRKVSRIIFCSSKCLDNQIAYCYCGKSEFKEIFSFLNNDFSYAWQCVYCKATYTHKSDFMLSDREDLEREGFKSYVRRTDEVIKTKDQEIEELKAEITDLRRELNEVITSQSVNISIPPAFYDEKSKECHVCDDTPCSCIATFLEE